MSDTNHTPEPFGYFKAEPFGWTDCSETEDGAIPLFDEAAIRSIQKQRDDLLAALNREAQSQHESGYEIDPWITDALASVKGTNK